MVPERSRPACATTRARADPVRRGQGRLQRRAVEVDQVHLAELAHQHRQIQIVAVAGAQHAQSVAPLDRPQQPGQSLAMWAVQIPPLARAVQLPLAPAHPFGHAFDDRPGVDPGQVPRQTG